MPCVRSRGNKTQQYSDHYMSGSVRRTEPDIFFLAWCPPSASRGRLHTEHIPRPNITGVDALDGLDRAIDALDPVSTTLSLSAAGHAIWLNRTVIGENAEIQFL